MAKNSKRFHRASAYGLAKKAEEMGFDVLDIDRKDLVKVSRVYFSEYKGKYNTAYHRKKSRDELNSIVSSVFDGSARNNVKNKIFSIVVEEREFVAESKPDTVGNDYNVYWNAIDTLLQNGLPVDKVNGIPVTGESDVEKMKNAQYLTRKFVSKFNDEQKEGDDYIVVYIENNELKFKLP